MSLTLRNRLFIIAAIVLAAVIALIPRNVKTRELVNGVVRDTVERRIPLKLGLDVRGGMHLALELDQSRQVSADPARDIELALTVLRKRIDEFGVTEPVIQKVGDDRIIVELAGVDDPARAQAIVQRNAFLAFHITEETGALEKALPAMDRALRQLGVTATGRGAAGPSAVERLLGGDSAATRDSASARDSAAKDSAAARADSAGPATRILAALIQDAGQGVPGEYIVEEGAYPRVDSLLNVPQVQRALPRGVVLRWASQPTSVGAQAYRFLYALEEKPLVTGSSLENAQAQLDPLTNGPIVTFQLDRLGGRRFGDGTGRHVGDYMAILLDNRVQGRPPVIQSRIDRRGQITLSGRTLQEAQDLAVTLNAGALPTPLKIVERRVVGASLGEDAIRNGLIAGAAGTLLVALIMVGYYRTAGMFAIAALGLYIVLTLGGLAALGAALTLPGIAGIVLSVGAAVDANVLIFERIKEELAAGKTMVLAANEGFSRAMNAVVDSNVCLILTAIFLYQFGTGPVRGFAVTLIIGTIASMITAVFVTRTLFLLWIARRPATSTMSI